MFRLIKHQRVCTEASLRVHLGIFSDVHEPCVSLSQMGVLSYREVSSHNSNTHAHRLLRVCYVLHA